MGKFVLVSIWFLCLYIFGYLAAVQACSWADRGGGRAIPDGQMIGESMGDHSITTTWWDGSAAVGIWTEDDGLFFGPQHAVPLPCPHGFCYTASKSH